MPENQRGKVWVVVANRSSARVYEADSLRGPLRLLHDLDKPQAQERERDLVSDRPGRSFDRNGPGRHAMDVAVDPREELAREFAREVAGVIEDGRKAASFERLVLVAGPRFLGYLRACLTDATSRLVAGEVSKNVTDLDAERILEYLEAL